jgi:DNA-binding XRE family transcriptional regulator
MNIDKQTTPEATLLELSDRLEQHRIEQGISQSELAKLAGVGKRTIERIEKGGDTQLTTLIRIIRVLGLSSRLDQLIPEQKISPMAMLHGKTKLPKRVKHKKDPVLKKQDWKWGDEQ